MKLEPPALFGEPVFAGGVVGHGPLQTLPEVAVVVGGAEMRQFVRNEVFDDARRQADGAPMKMQRALMTVRGPATAEIAGST